MTRSPDDDAVRRFIGQSMVVRIATRSPRGNPDVIPLYFVQHRGRIYMATRSENPVVRDLLVNPEVVLLFHAERRPRRDRVLRIRGRAAFLTEGRTLRPVYARFVLRYYLSPGGLWNSIRNLRLFPIRVRYGRERAGEGGAVEVIPETAEFLRTPWAPDRSAYHE